MVYGMDSYYIVLHITMELCWLAVLLCNSTLTKEAHHRCYSELLDEISDFKPQPALGD